jgi:hypothetical protein
MPAAGSEVRFGVTGAGACGALPVVSVGHAFSVLPSGSSGARNQPATAIPGNASAGCTAWKDWVTTRNRRCRYVMIIPSIRLTVLVMGSKLFKMLSIWPLSPLRLRCSPLKIRCSEK